MEIGKTRNLFMYEQGKALSIGKFHQLFGVAQKEFSQYKIPHKSEKTHRKEAKSHKIMIFVSLQKEKKTYQLLALTFNKGTGICLCSLVGQTLWLMF